RSDAHNPPVARGIARGHAHGDGSDSQRPVLVSAQAVGTEGDLFQSDLGPDRRLDFDLPKLPEIAVLAAPDHDPIGPLTRAAVILFKGVFDERATEDDPGIASHGLRTGVLDD